MRNLLYVAAFSLSLVVGMVSCQQEIPDPTPGDISSIRARINGARWEAVTSRSASISNGAIHITGMGSRKMISINIGDTKTGTYTLTDTSLHAATWVDSTSSNPAAFTTNASNDPAKAGGSVHINRIDTATKRISGTFAFRVYRAQDSLSLNITEGIFQNVQY